MARRPLDLPDAFVVLAVVHPPGVSPEPMEHALPNHEVQQQATDHDGEGSQGDVQHPEQGELVSEFHAGDDSGERQETPTFS